MKSASGVLYTIGRIFNVIEIIFAAIATVFAALIMANPSAIYDQLVSEGNNHFSSAVEIETVGITMLVLAILTLVVSIIIYILAKRAQRSLKADEKNSKPHIVMLVIGVFGDLFYLLGGVFGLINSTEANNKQE
ncbi:MAG: hypothetical protein IJ542_00135 [Clostridia bacterium]|nr:hypothetical protein [Clostridia bacterium]